MVAERDAGLRGADPVEVVRGPDVHDRQLPAVELMGRDRGGLVTVEHTVIESYPAQIAERKALQAMFLSVGPRSPNWPMPRSTRRSGARPSRSHRLRALPSL